MKNIRSIWFLLSVMLIGAITITAVSCATTPAEVRNNTLPPVFEGIMQPGVQGAPPVEVVLDAGLPITPAEMTVYKVINPDVTDKYASDLAQKLGFSGTSVPLSQGDKREVYTYINGTSTLEIHLDGSLAIYYTGNLDIPQDLPSPQESITIAQDWLFSHNLLDPNSVTAVKVAPYRTIDGKALATGVEFTIDLDGYDNMSGLGAYVVVADGGKVIEARINTPTIEKYIDVTLKTPDKALEILKGYLSSPDAVPPEAEECVINMRSFSRLIVKNISIQYRIGGGYLQPVYVFEGEAYDQYDPAIKAFVGMGDAVSR